MTLSAHPVWAGSPQCGPAYKNAADDYWRIVGDMVQFKAIFDNYNTLCEKYYPDEIASLQPDADHLRATIAQDVKNITPVMTAIFNTTLPAAVPPACATDKKTRDRIRKEFLGDVKTRGKTLTARMNKSAATLHDPTDSLKLCRDLRALAPKIKKKLGPDLAAPLLTMSEMNSRYMVKDSNKMKDAFATYRETLSALPPAKK